MDRSATAPEGRHTDAMRFANLFAHFADLHQFGGAGCLRMPPLRGLTDSSPQTSGLRHWLKLFRRSAALVRKSLPPNRARSFRAWAISAAGEAVLEAQPVSSSGRPPVARGASPESWGRRAARA